MKHEIVALRLKEALERAHITQQELADRAEINKASVSQYMSGTHCPSNVKAAKMAAVLKVSPVWLMGFDVAMIDEPAETKMKSYLPETEAGKITLEIENHLENMSTDSLKHLLKYIEFMERS